MSDNLFAPLIVLFVALGVAVLLVRWALAHARFRRESEMQLQLHTRLIDKFGTPKELGEYLQSDAGRAFLTPPPAERVTPYRRILGSAQAGIVLVLVGMAIWLLRGGDVEQSHQTVHTLSVLGGVTLALGLGFIASAVLAYVLSARWGLLNGKRTPPDDVQ